MNETTEQVTISSPEGWALTLVSKTPDELFFSVTSSAPIDWTKQAIEEVCRALDEKRAAYWFVGTIDDYFLKHLYMIRLTFALPPADTLPPAHKVSYQTPPVE